MNQTANKNLFKIYWIFTCASFLILGESLIILYAIRLEASNFFISAISAIQYFSLIFLLFGRYFIKKLGYIRTQGTFWVARYISMLPLVVTPYLFSKGYKISVYIIFIICLLGFNFSRGIGMTGFNSILGYISYGKNKGAFLTDLKIISNATTIIFGMILSYILSKFLSLNIYSVLIALGALLGITGVVFLFKIPELEYTESANKMSLYDSVKNILKRKELKRYFSVFFLISLFTGIFPSFLILYMKRVYCQNDGIILFFTIFGSMGALFYGFFNRFLIDRLGSKPIFYLSIIIAILTVSSLIFFPRLSGYYSGIIFFGLIFFFYFMGKLGIENCDQNYFLELVPQEERLNMGIINQGIIGGAGIIGSLTGGFILEYFHKNNIISEINSFKALFIIIAINFVLILFLIPRMKNFGKYTLTDFLSIIISPKDLKAISLLNNLDKTKTPFAEKYAVRSLSNVPSVLAVEDLLKRLDSPRYYIRIEALKSLHNLPPDKIDGKVVSALIREIKKHQYSSGYFAAKILGKSKIKDKEIKEILLRCLKSKCVILCSKSVVALARLNDRRALKKIENIILETDNISLLIHCFAALEIFKSVDSIPVIINKIDRTNRKCLLNEAILSISVILEIGDWFFPIYKSYIEDRYYGCAHLYDYIDTLKKINNEKILEIIKIFFDGDSSNLYKELKKIITENIKTVNLKLLNTFKEYSYNGIKYKNKRSFDFLICCYIIKKYSEQF